MSDRHGKGKCFYMYTSLVAFIWWESIRVDLCIPVLFVIFEILIRTFKWCYQHVICQSYCQFRTRKALTLNPYDPGGCYPIDCTALVPFWLSKVYSDTVLVLSTDNMVSAYGRSLKCNKLCRYRPMESR